MTKGNCGFCGGPLTFTATGRIGKYCGKTCSNNASLQRQGKGRKFEPMSMVNKRTGERIRQENIKRLNGAHHCLACLGKIGLGSKLSARVTGLSLRQVMTLKNHFGIEAALPPSGAWWSKTRNQNLSRSRGTIAGMTIDQWQRWAWKEDLKEMRSHPDWRNHPECLKWGYAKRQRDMWRKGCPILKARMAIRSRVRKTLARYHDGTLKKADSTVALLGCSVSDFVAHIERQWKKGMTWDNHGVGKGNWNIDHIVPCSHFDLSDPVQQKACFHWSNQRPLWAVQNIARGSRASVTMPLNLQLSIQPQR